MFKRSILVHIYGGVSVQLSTSVNILKQILSVQVIGALKKSTISPQHLRGKSWREYIKYFLYF